MSDLFTKRRHARRAIVAVAVAAAVVWFALRTRNHSPANREAAHNDDASVSHNPDSPRPPAVAIPTNSYTGSSVCAECHSEIAERYSSHSMAKSLSSIASAPVIEDYEEDTTFSPDGEHIYSVERTAKAVQHRERLVTPDGKTVFDQAVPVDYAVGSGSQGRSYLIDRDGILFMSPISWYTKAAKWALSPGYTLPHHRRFSRRVREACLDCHAGRLNTKRGSDDRFGEPPFLELSIGCERCHGPGKPHVQYWRGPTRNAGKDPIVNPAKLAPAQREAVCSQCHLQGEGRIPRYGHEVGDYRPGERLEDTCIIFVMTEETDSDHLTRAVSQVEQMRTSVCFRESQGRMGCTSCHDPHSTPTKAEEVNYYRNRCLTCHEQHGCSLPHDVRIMQQPNDSCFSCHMNSMGASDVPHAAHTDHRILRTPAKSVAASSEISNELPRVFDGADKRLDKVVVDRALGIWMAERAESTSNIALAAQAAQVLSQVAHQMPFDADVQANLGTASATLGRIEPAIISWRKALSIDPDRELTLRMLAVTLSNFGRTLDALPYIRRYLNLNPFDAPIWVRYCALLLQDGQTVKAVEAAKKAVSLDPSIEATYPWLTELLKKSAPAGAN